MFWQKIRLGCAWHLYHQKTLSFHAVLPFSYPTCNLTPNFFPVRKQIENEKISLSLLYKLFLIFANVCFFNFVFARGEQSKRLSVILDGIKKFELVSNV